MIQDLRVLSNRNAIAKRKMRRGERGREVGLDNRTRSQVQIPVGTQQRQIVLNAADLRYSYHKVQGMRPSSQRCLSAHRAKC